VTPNVSTVRVRHNKLTQDRFNVKNTCSLSLPLIIISHYCLSTLSTLYSVSSKPLSELYKSAPIRTSMTLLLRQRMWLAILPKISSVFSLFGSTWIIIEVATEKRKRQAPYHRLLFAMSVYDVLESLWNFGSTWPIPEGSPDVIWATGNTATCTAQGFFLTLSVAVPLYNAMLSLYYVLVINYNYSDRRLREFVEPAMHTFAFVWAFGTALYSALAGLLNNANLWCWIAPLPSDCLDSWIHGTAEEGNPNPCIRGDNVWIYRFGFYFIPLWISILFASKSYSVVQITHLME
jgi:hypothetical protein